MKAISLKVDERLIYLKQIADQGLQNAVSIQDKITIFAGLPYGMKMATPRVAAEIRSMAETFLKTHIGAVGQILSHVTSADFCHLLESIMSFDKDRVLLSVVSLDQLCLLTRIETYLVR